MPGRTKISVSLPAELVAHVDRGVRARRYLSRSAAIEEALRLLERGDRDREIEAYYAGRGQAERDDERAWGEVGAEALAISARAEERSGSSRAAEVRAAYGVRRGRGARAAEAPASYGVRRGGARKKAR